MNLTEMIARCRFRYRDPASVLLRDEEWTDHLNDARDEFLMLVPTLATHDTVVTATTDVGDRVLDMPDSITAWHSVRAVHDLTNQRPVKPAPRIRSALRDYPYGDDQTGQPDAFAIEGNVFYVFPTPDGAYELEIFLAVDSTRIVDADDVPPEPDAYHQAYVYGAIERAAHDDENYQFADRARSRFNDLVKTARDYEPLTRVGAYPEVTDDFWEE